MGFSNFIYDKFMDKEICVFIDIDAESVVYAESWVANKTYFRGFVKSINDGILTLEIPDNGSIYINCDSIISIWEPSFDYHKAISTSLTKKMVGAKK